MNKFSFQNLKKYYYRSVQVRNAVIIKQSLNLPIFKIPHTPFEKQLKSKFKVDVSFLDHIEQYLKLKYSQEINNNNNGN